jgi:DNA-binding PadR family transcriptional regulator
MPKFRDHSLLPKEVIRLAALGLLAAGPKTYGDLAVEVRHFASRMLGPTLDILGTSIELLRHEGLIEPIGPRAGPSQSLRAETSVRLTEAGRAALHELLTSPVRVPMTDLTRMVVALKLRFLHLLSPDDQRAQFEMLIELTDAELVRLGDLRKSSAEPSGALDDWLAQEIAQTQERRAWYARRLDAVVAGSH